VSVRVRPLSEAEAERGAAWRIDGNTIKPEGREAGSEAVYTLDNIFDAGWTTEAVYRQTTQDIVAKVVGGFNGTVFAYGQTSSGKTHTMRGTAADPGIVPLAVQDIFDRIAATQEREYLLRVSYMEASSCPLAFHACTLCFSSCACCMHTPACLPSCPCMHACMCQAWLLLAAACSVQACIPEALICWKQQVTLLSRARSCTTRR
jgi:hypothetical protein